ncbi:alanine/ornithine racemase family PLP-dependent enzyme [bacterium]|nr:alanine/ornithine racemase family PLP-dependent enzyme [bacterium]
MNRSRLTAPRLQIDLDKVYHNAQVLVSRLNERGISVTGVTKATLGFPEIARAWLRAGVSGLADSRIENIDTLRRANVVATFVLIRSPMLSQVDQVSALADVSLNTELEVIRSLSSAAGKLNRTHGIVLMVELGDLREGIMPELMDKTVAEVLRLPNISLEGIGANLACRSGVSPDAVNMAKLSSLVDSLELTFGIVINTVSGGNSANLDWALSCVNIGRINNLRLGEALLLGCEPLHRKTIEGLHTDAITLIAEVIESKEKPSRPWGEIAQSAFGEVAKNDDTGSRTQSILAIGCQDVDPEGLMAPSGIVILGASSDHLVVDSSNYPSRLSVGDEVSFQLNYSALLRAMTSPYVAKVITC